jgi:glutathione S-transferase
MSFIYIVTILAILEFFWFGLLVARARAKYGVKAPAMTGNEFVERAIRVQMNTLEQLAGFLPAVFIAAQFWSPKIVALFGLVYLIGRMVYARAYVVDPSKRELGFMMTIVPTCILLIAGLIGAILKLSQ